MFISGFIRFIDPTQVISRLALTMTDLTPGRTDMSLLFSPSPVANEMSLIDPEASTDQGTASGRAIEDMAAHILPPVPPPTTSEPPTTYGPSRTARSTSRNDSGVRKSSTKNRSGSREKIADLQRQITLVQQTARHINNQAVNQQSLHDFESEAQQRQLTSSSAAHFQRSLVSQQSWPTIVHAPTQT